jgi:hypothetical protein
MSKDCDLSENKNKIIRKISEKKMKKKLIYIYSLAFFLISYVNVFALCEGWDGSMTRIVTYNGCQIEYTFCYRINQQTGFHEISIPTIKVLLPCNGSMYDANKSVINDAILNDIALNSGLFGGIWVDEVIPPCPTTLCNLKIYDAICYNGWQLVGNKWEMNTCDNEKRSCNEVVRFCWEIVNGVRVLRITKEGYPTGPPCPPPVGCSTNCG